MILNGLKCKLEKRISKKSGNEYTVLIIEDLAKVVFLTDAEVKLLELIYGKKQL